MDRRADPLGRGVAGADERPEEERDSPHEEHEEHDDEPEEERETAGGTSNARWGRSWLRGTVGMVCMCCGFCSLQ